MSSLTELQSATDGLMQAGSDTLTLRENRKRTQLHFKVNVTSGRMVKRGGEPSAKKGRRKTRMSMKTTTKKKNPCEPKFSQIGFSELVV